MKREFDLSKEMIRDTENVDVLLKGSVKEFIKRLKDYCEDYIAYDTTAIQCMIDKLAGDDLI